MSFLRRALTLASIALLAACAKTVQVPVSQPPVLPPPVTVPPPVVVTPPPPPNARAAGIRLVAPPAALDEISAARALTAFRISCPVLVRRTDTSLLTNGSDWSQVCTDAAAVAPGGAGAFFRDSFDWMQVADGKAFATGYYEPTIQGSRVPLPGYAPIYGVPTDLVRCTRTDGVTGRARFDATGACVPYFSRAEVEDGALANRGAEIAWAADPVDLFFVEIQGSGRVVFPDGTSIRIGYAEQNGLPYTPIGKLLRDRGILPPGGANMEAIKAWIRANPDQGRALMRENQSYIFFKTLTGPGPLGSINVPLTPHGTVATDPKFVPLGAPVFLTMDRPEPNGFWVAQDVGGAIKGSNRFDTFWGGGPDAQTLAGGMSANGRALLLLPKGAAARALAQP